MRARIPLINGPAPTAKPAQKFWNVVSAADGDAAEITMYGDVCAQQPIDWWTGEPEPGMYIAVFDSSYFRHIVAPSAMLIIGMDFFCAYR